MPERLRRETDLAIVCWRGTDDEVTTGCPLPVRYAEAVARAFQSSDPSHRYWVESLPWLASLRRGPRRDRSTAQ